MNELQKKAQIQAIRVGMLISIAFSALFIIIFFLGSFYNIFVKKKTIYATIENVNGLRRGAPVWLRGVEVGSVNDIHLSTKRIIITMAIIEKQSQFYQDTKFQIRTMGLLGDKFIELMPGSNNRMFDPMRDTLQGVVPINFDHLAESSTQIINKAESTIDTILSLVTYISQSDGSLKRVIGDKELYNNIVQLTVSLNHITKMLENKNNNFVKILNDSLMYNQLNLSSTYLASFLTDINNGKGLAGAFVRDSLIIQELTKSIQDVRELISDIKKNPKRYISFSIF